MIVYVDTQALCEEYHSAAENALNLKEQLKQQEEAHTEALASLEEKLHSVENRCIELLQLKMGQEKDISRLRSENMQLMTNEEFYKGQYEEMKKQSSLAVRRSDLTIQQVHEDCQLAIETETKRCNRVKENLEDEIEELKKSKEDQMKMAEEEKTRLEAVIEEWKKRVENLSQELKKQEEDWIQKHSEEMKKQKEELQNGFDKEIASKQSDHSTQLQTLKTEFQKTLEQKCQQLKEELEKKAEQERSDLEMKMVRAKEKALADQTAVYQTELAQEEKKCEERIQELSRNHEKDSADVHKLFDKESEEYRRVIADLRKSIDSKDAELKELNLQLKENQVQHEKTEELSRIVTDLRASIDAKDSEMREQASQLASLKDERTKFEEEIKTLRKAVMVMDGEEQSSHVLELAKEEERKEEEMRQRLEEMEKRIKELAEMKKKVEDDLDHERQERKDESKRNVVMSISLLEQQEKINDLKKKCVKFKAIVVKLKEKLPSDSKKKKSLQKKEKHTESTSESDFDNEGWNISSVCSSKQKTSSNDVSLQLCTIIHDCINQSRNLHNHIIIKHTAATPPITAQTRTRK